MTIEIKNTNHETNLAGLQKQILILNIFNLIFFSLFYLFHAGFLIKEFLHLCMFAWVLIYSRISPVHITGLHCTTVRTLEVTFCPYSLREYHIFFS